MIFFVIWVLSGNVVIHEVNWVRFELLRPGRDSQRDFPPFDVKQLSPHSTHRYRFPPHTRPIPFLGVPQRKSKPCDDSCGDDLFDMEPELLAAELAAELAAHDEAVAIAMEEKRRTRSCNGRVTVV